MKEKLIVYGGGALGMAAIIGLTIYWAAVFNPSTNEVGTYNEEVDADFTSFTFEGEGKFRITK